MKKGRIDVYLVAGGKYHDIDFARLEILKLLNADERFRVRVGEDYRDIDAIKAADFLITYTCDVLPSASELAALKSFLDDGKRWFALHGTNSILQFLDDGRVDTPDSAPEFMEMLGTQFMAHPPICTFKVDISDPNHSLTRGIEPFEVEDELYLTRDTGNYHLLLETHFEGKAKGFVVEDWVDDRPQPVFYIRDHGKGAVLYLTLGHCRGKYDLQSLGIEEYAPIERCSWESPVYYELLRRGIAWAAGDMEG